MGLAVDPDRVLADLRELRRRTGDDAGAQRVCWTDTWVEAREFLHGELRELGIEAERDEAGNIWAQLAGAEDRPALAVGSHLDSVPDGGWLDGALGVMAALEVLRAQRRAGEPARPLVLVDWADEEGARFGRSLFGSSAFAGTLDPAALRGLTDRNGESLAAVLAAHGVDLDEAPRSANRRGRIGALLELHIEQGPQLEQDGLPVAAVSGCVGVERLAFTFHGQAAHAGTTPMDARRDAGLGAAAAALAIESIPATHGGVATTGRLDLRPGIATAVAGEATLTVDLRNGDADALARMLDDARAACGSAARERRLELAEEEIWRIAPIPFDPALVSAAREVCAARAGRPAELESGALHDAAEVARVLPAGMLFSPSKLGISHAVQEDTDEADLRVAIEAFGELVERVLRP